MAIQYPAGIAPDDQIILFDAQCKLCNRWSRFIIRFDTRRRFKLCSIQSEAGQALLQWLAYPLDHFDTMLLLQGNHVLNKSSAFCSFYHVVMAVFY